MGEDTIALLVNPVPDKKRKKAVDEISKILIDRKISFTSFPLQWPVEINIFKEAWIIGGDGTLNYFLNFYKSIQVPIAIFKFGTGNDFAWKLYGKMNLVEQIDHVLTATPQCVDAAKCNEQIFINGVGIGFEGEVIRSMKTIRFLGKHIGYLWVVIKKIFSFKEYSYQINYDSQLVNGRFLLVIITNSSRVGGGFMVSPSADIADGKLNMILCKPLPVLERLINLPLIEKGEHLEKKFIVHKRVTNVKISCAHEVSAHIDGELISGSSFEITILPHFYLFKY